MKKFRLEVYNSLESVAWKKNVSEAKEYLKLNLEKTKTLPFYLVETKDEERFTEHYKEVFSDSVCEEVLMSREELFDKKPNYVAQVSFKAGVTDNTAKSAVDALTLVGVNARVASGKIHFLWGNLEQVDAEKIASELFGNSLIEDIIVESYESFMKRDRFENVALPEVILKDSLEVKEVDLKISDAELIKLSEENVLALRLDEMTFIRDFFEREDVQAARKENGLGEKITDVELEVIAQSWSEHCKHKIFAADIFYSEDASVKNKIGSKKIESLYKRYIKGSTKEIEEERNLPWLKSVFSDNAGVVRFDENIDLCIKAETHNSPSALDPYGGALTGILGVNRDILGCGMGAKPIANTDVFCFASPKYPLDGDESLMPKGLMQPRRLLEGVHKGIEDGGNKSGIPTVNGAIYFDDTYAGKPLVFCGTVGTLPHKLNDGRDAYKKYLSPGDHIFMVGGAIGADGIHGATFSSLELNENSPATAVQIGDPITQKRVMDFLLEARDLGLFTCVTDNGAGGLSSSVGEMATLSNGAEIDLKKCPTKYPGLKPFELMISESQERMTVAVAPEKCEEFLALSKKRGVESTDIGTFKNDGFLKVFYGEKIVALLDLEFLHEMLPPMKLDANYKEEKWEYKSWLGKDYRKEIAYKKTPEFYKEVLLDLLSSPNIASKESWVRQYDHEVQGATHIKPFCGKNSEGPSNSGVVWLYPHGGEKENAISIGCGIAPRMSTVDPFLMAQTSVDEAIRNIVSTGADIDHTCLLDNFCWPDPVESEKNPGGSYKLGALVRTCEGLYEACKVYGTPLVSGKDSMKNDFRGKNLKGDDLKISIHPTLLVTAMGKTQINATATSDFKKSGDLIYFIGKENASFAGSELSYLYKIEDEVEMKRPLIELETNKRVYKKIYEGHQNKIFESIHDLSDGGLAVAVSESAIGGDLGADISLDFVELDALHSLFAERSGSFVVSIKTENKEAFEDLFRGYFLELGTVSDIPKVCFQNNNQELFHASLSEVKSAWQKEF